MYELTHLDELRTKQLLKRSKYFYFSKLEVNLWSRSICGLYKIHAFLFIRKWFIRKYYYIGQNLKKFLVLPHTTSQILVYA